MEALCRACPPSGGYWRPDLKNTIAPLIAVLLAGTIFCARANDNPVLEVRAERASQLGNKTVALRYDLLRQALQASGRSFTLTPCELPEDQVSDMRYLLLVRDNKGCNVTATSAGASGTKDLLLVPVPMYLGAGGYRVMFVHKTARSKLEAVRTLDDLRTISIGSGTAWVDTDIMRAAQLKVETSEYDRLFQMLQRGRFDAYSRSILEINNEKNMVEGLSNVEVDQHLLLHYPNDLFFYVSPREPEIQKAITQGMEKLFASGKLMQRLHTAVGTPAEMKALKLKERQRIDIPNPYLRPDEDAALKKYGSAWVQ